MPNLRDGDFQFEKVLSHLSFCWIFIECFLWPSNKRQGINFLALRQKRKGKNPLGAASREKRNVHSLIDCGVHILQKRSEKKNLSLSKEKSQKAHLSKGTSGRNNKSRQLPRIHFLSTVFHALSHGMSHFLPSVSFTNISTIPWNNAFCPLLWKAEADSE